MKKADLNLDIFKKILGKTLGSTMLIMALAGFSLVKAPGCAKAQTVDDNMGMSNMDNGGMDFNGDSQYNQDQQPGQGGQNQQNTQGQNQGDPFAYQKWYQQTYGNGPTFRPPNQQGQARGGNGPQAQGSAPGMDNPTMSPNGGQQNTQGQNQGDPFAYQKWYQQTYGNGPTFRPPNQQGQARGGNGPQAQGSAPGMDNPTMSPNGGQQNTQGQNQGDPFAYQKWYQQTYGNGPTFRPPNQQGQARGGNGPGMTNSSSMGAGTMRM